MLKYRRDFIKEAGWTALALMSAPFFTIPAQAQTLQEFGEPDPDPYQLGAMINAEECSGNQNFLFSMLPRKSYFAVGKKYHDTLTLYYDPINREIYGSRIFPDGWSSSIDTRYVTINGSQIWWYYMSNGDRFFIEKSTEDAIDHTVPEY